MVPVTGETLQVYFLGTAGALPTPQRNLSCIMVRRGSDTLLFDCGEGAQQQMMRARTGFTVDAIFVTHWHADHFLGVFGLVQTLSFMGRTGPLVIYGPPWVRELVAMVDQIAGNDPGFAIEPRELRPGAVVPFSGYAVHTFPTTHGMPGLGYALVEDTRPGRFNREQALELGVPAGPLFGRLQRGEAVRVTRNGSQTEVRPDQVMGEPRPGRKVVYTGDTRPVPDVMGDLCRDADLLIHDATFDDTELTRAREVFHSTAGEAGQVARALSARCLALVHLSPRYTSPAAHLADAKKYFSGEVIAPADLTMREIPFRD